LWATRERYGRGSSQGLEAFHRLVAAYKADGRRIDELRRYEPDEAKRFFSLCLEGGNGHVYWNGSKAFKMNDGKTRKPVLWWWNYSYGQKPDRLRQICGQDNCINPRHAALDSMRGPKRIYPDHWILGALQVLALQQGHSPSVRDWTGPPSHTIVKQRFGSWDNALKAAGLPPSAYNRPRSREDAFASLRFVRDLLGHWPSWNEFVSHAAELRSQDLPSAASTIRRHFGSWPNAIRAANRA
jgi:hypothetical protein